MNGFGFSSAIPPLSKGLTEGLYSAIASLSKGPVQ